MKLLTLILPLPIAILIDAFFVFPIIFDIDLVRGAGREYISNKFFINGILQLNFSLVKLPWEQQLSKYFWVNLAIFLGVIASLRFSQEDYPKSILLKLQILMVAFAIFMMSDLSLWLYETITIFKKLQFPWRFLVITSSLTPYLSSYFLENLITRFPIVRKKFFFCFFLIIFVFVIYKSAFLLLMDLCS